MDTDLEGVANFLFELGMLKKTVRSGYSFLGSGKESIADHSFRVAIIAHTLAMMSNHEPHKVVMMALLHDIHESRTGDQNYVHKQYVKTDEQKAFNDATRRFPWKDMYRAYWNEYREGATKGAQLVKDADQLDLLIELKEQQDLGNAYAAKWIKYLLKRLKTEEAKTLATAIMKTDWTDWWFKDHDSWWTK